MTASRRVGRDAVAPWGPKIYLLWAGLSLGVAFLATPVKFLAPSLTLPVALDVGRHTFRVYNSVELALFALLLIMGLWSRRRRRWYLAALVPGAIILAQGLWFIPALDLRAVAIQAEGTAPSSLHAVYVAVEALKVLWLLAMGLGDVIAVTDRNPRARRRPEPQSRRP